jgi:hypothetical protein
MAPLVENIALLYSRFPIQVFKTNLPAERNSGQLYVREYVINKRNKTEKKRMYKEMGQSVSK